MLYFFDESGNWNYLQGNKKLVLAGIVVKNIQSFDDIIYKLNEFKSNNNISNIHSAELSSDTKEKLISLIADLFNNKLISAKITFYSINSLKILYEKNLKDQESVYIEKASDFVIPFIFGDNQKDIRIFWDMKFRYNHLAAIINRINENFSFPFYNLNNNYSLNDASLKEKKNELLDRLRKLKTPNSIIKKLIESLTKNNSNVKDIIKKFDLSELELYLTKTVSMRDKFKHKIQGKLEQKYSYFGLLEKPVFNITYLDKYSNSKFLAGIEIVDALAHLFYTNGIITKSNMNVNSSIKTIYNLSKVEVL